jgi:hypothetical protein
VVKIRPRTVSGAGGRDGLARIKVFGKLFLLDNSREIGDGVLLGMPEAVKRNAKAYVI